MDAEVGTYLASLGVGLPPAMERLSGAGGGSPTHAAPARHASRPKARPRLATLGKILWKTFLCLLAAAGILAGVALGLFLLWVMLVAAWFLLVKVVLPVLVCLSIVFAIILAVR